MEQENGVFSQPDVRRQLKERTIQLDDDKQQTK